MHAVRICRFSLKLHKGDRVSPHKLGKQTACKLNSRGNFDKLRNLLYWVASLKPSLGKKSAHLKNLFKLIHLKLFELIIPYKGLTVVKLEMGGVPSARNRPSLQRLQAVGAVPECFSYSERSCPLG